MAYTDYVAKAFTKRGSTRYAAVRPVHPPGYFPQYGGVSKFKKVAARRSNTQKQINSLNRRIGGFMGLEMKFLDTSIALTAIDTQSNLTGANVDPVTIDCLNSMVQGDGEQERLGRHIVMHSIKVKGHVELPLKEDSGIPLDQIGIKCYLILDKQTNAAQMLSAQVFTNQGAAIDGTTQLFRNMQHTDRYTVLDSYSTVIKPNQTVSTDAGGVATFFHHGKVIHNFSLGYRWPRGKKVLYAGTTGTIANIQDHSLHVLAFADEAGEVAQIVYNARLRYTTT